MTFYPRWIGILRLVSLGVWISVALPSNARAELNYHLVGWLNAALPGSGAIAEGEPLQGSLEALGELSSFGVGYSLSQHSPFSLDGATDTLPGPIPGQGPIDVSRLMAADFLQEVGLKAHMVDTFNSYRRAAKNQGVTDGIDQMPTWDLFKAPFDPDRVTDPWVAIPLAVAAVAIVGDYFVSRNSGLSPVARLTPASNALYGMTYAGIYPVGSGAPEEMFFRGFLQSEMTALVPGPYFAVPAQAAAYAFSHSTGRDRLSAALTGLYLGALAYRSGGQLSPGIAFHFWVDVFSGTEALLLALAAETQIPPTSLAIQLEF